MRNAVIEANIAGCARCHLGHPRVRFRRLRRPVRILPANESVTEVKLTHWSTCPETGEPLLATWTDGIGWQNG